MSTMDRERLHPVIDPRLARIAKSLPQAPPWSEPWLGLGPQSTEQGPSRLPGHPEFRHSPCRRGLFSRVAHPAFRGVGVTSSSISATQQRFAPFSNVLNELKESQVKRQFLLRNPPMRSEPRPQQRPKALNRVDMDFAKSIPILVAGELPGRVTHGVVGIAPIRSTDRKCHIHRCRQQFL